MGSGQVVDWVSFAEYLELVALVSSLPEKGVRPFSVLSTIAGN